MHSLAPKVSRVLQRRAWLGAVAASLVLGVSAASAEPLERVGYSQTQVYSAAVRYLRIDLRYDITERDPEAAYLLFEYQPLGQKSTRFGAVEIVKLQQGVRLVVHLPDQPSYQATMLRDGLLKKLRADYGELQPGKAAPEPPPSKKPAPDEKSPPEPDEGTSELRPNARS